MRGWAVLLQPARGELMRGGVNFQAVFQAPDLGASSRFRSEERRGAGGAGGEDANRSRCGGVGYNLGGGRRHSWFLAWLRGRGGSGLVVGTICARLEVVVAVRVAVAAATSTNITRGIPVVAEGLTIRVAHVACHHVRRRVVARTVALETVVVIEMAVRSRLLRVVATFVAEAATVRTL